MPIIDRREKSYSLQIPPATELQSRKQERLWLAAGVYSYVSKAEMWLEGWCCLSESMPARSCGGSQGIRVRSSRCWVRSVHIRCVSYAELPPRLHQSFSQDSLMGKKAPDIVLNSSEKPDGQQKMLKPTFFFNSSSSIQDVNRKINKSVLPSNDDKELQQPDTAQAVNMGLSLSPRIWDLSRSFLLHVQSSIMKTSLGPATTQT